MATEPLDTYNVIPSKTTGSRLHIVSMLNYPLRQFFETREWRMEGNRMNNCNCRSRSKDETNVLTIERTRWLSTVHECYLVSEQVFVRQE